MQSDVFQDFQDTENNNASTGAVRNVAKQLSGLDRDEDGASVHLMLQ